MFLRRMMAWGLVLLSVVGSEAAGQAAGGRSQAIPADTNYAALASRQVEMSGLSTEVREGQVAGEEITSIGDSDVELAVAGSSATAAGFVDYEKPCYDNFELHYLLTVTTGDIPIRDVTLTVQYGEGASGFQTRGAGSERNPDQIDAENRLLIWQEDGLPANTSWTQSLIFDIQDPASGGLLVTLSYSVGGELRSITIGYPLPSCYGPNRYESDKLPAVICHPAEPGCEGFLPELGRKFTEALTPQVCSEHDPDQCQDFLPSLGIRFREAYPDVVPGECRVLEDDRLALPELHDALLRDGDPAAPLLRSMYQSSQDFKRSIVQANGIDGVKFFKEGRRRLLDIHNAAWGEQAAVLLTALEGGGGNTQSAEAELDGILATYRQEVQAELRTQIREYSDLQEGRKKRYEPLVEPAVERAKSLIQAACSLPEPTDDAGLEAALEGPVKTTYERMLEVRLEEFQSLPGKLASLSVVAEVWSQGAKPALAAFYRTGDEQPLRDYLQTHQARSARTFEEQFAIYLDFKDEDERLVTEVRLGDPALLGNILGISGTQTWEGALDAPKTRATGCYLDQVLSLPVESTVCEAGPAPPPEILQRAPWPAKANGVIFIGGIGSEIAPPNTAALDQEAPRTAINPVAVAGVPCGGRPGDPFWANDCSCNCGQVVPGLAGGLGSCPLSKITRHDVNVSTVEECLNEPDDHLDPLGLPFSIPGP